MCAHSLPLLIWFVLTHGQNLHSEKSVHCLSSISASPPSLLTQCQGTGCGTHPHARAFTHSMCLASSHVISPKFLSSSFLLQPHDTVFTGCLLRDGCGTNPRPPGPSPTLSGFFRCPLPPNFTPRVLFFNSMTPPSLDVILRPVRLIHADRGRHLFCLASSHALISTSTSVALSPVVHCMAH